MSKKYDSYKDSEIDWIGDLPSNWQIKRIKHTTYVKGRIGWQGMRSDEFLESSDSYVVTGTDFEKGLVKWDTCYQVPLERYEEDPFIQLREGDLLITKDGTIGKIAVVKNIPKIATLNSGVFLTRPLSNSYVPEFMYWILYSDVFKSFYDYNKSGSTIQHLYQNVFNEFKFPLPTIEEQITIANYLDQKTSQIDDLIAKKERLIQLLEEERTAIINQAVTKGLDPTVPIKDSGIDGLGLIPLNWKLMKFKMFAPILTCGVASTPEYVDESVGVPFLSAQNVKNNRMRLDNYKHISTDLHNSLTKNRKPQNGDILVTRVGAGIGDACIVDCNFEFSVYVSLTHIRVDESIVKNKFIMYFFSTDYCKYLNSQGTVTGGGVGNLNVNNVERYKVPIPPLEEQELIVDFITSKSTEIDKIVFKTQQEIELLKEYKTALISEVVTGKVDVRYEKLN